MNFFQANFFSLRLDENKREKKDNKTGRGLKRVFKFRSALGTLERSDLFYYASQLRNELITRFYDLEIVNNSSKTALLTRGRQKFLFALV
ncbi:MAG: hypothetical protein GF383_07670 [Candidatus Lokiarchaeota archaeon]|nr:hypothetical protein [Candidatus Lokiarchaeota archaeon]